MLGGLSTHDAGVLEEDVTPIHILYISTVKIPMSLVSVTWRWRDYIGQRLDKIKSHALSSPSA